jgi:hypothetical protein
MKDCLQRRDEARKSMGEYRLCSNILLALLVSGMKGGERTDAESVVWKLDDECLMRFTLCLFGSGGMC